MSWLRKAKSHLRECLSPEKPLTTPPEIQRRGHVERVTIPTFSGAPEDYHEFRRVFTELTGGEGYSPAVLMAQLRTHLPVDAKKLVEGIVTVGEAWKELER